MEPLAIPGTLKYRHGNHIRLFYQELTKCVRLLNGPARLWGCINPTWIIGPRQYPSNSRYTACGITRETTQQEQGIEANLFGKGFPRIEVPCSIDNWDVPETILCRNSKKQINQASAWISTFSEFFIEISNRQNLLTWKVNNQSWKGAGKWDVKRCVLILRPFPWPSIDQSFTADADDDELGKCPGVKPHRPIED